MVKMLIKVFYLLMATTSLSLSAADDISIADFESGNYGEWQVEGQAFGQAPAQGSISENHRVTGFTGKRLVDSFLEGGDAPTGTLSSAQFTLERDYLNVLIGGGSDISKVGLKLLVEGKEVARITGSADEKLVPISIPIKKYAGKKARIVIFDHAKKSWGHINIDEITLSNTLTNLTSQIANVRTTKTLKITKKLLLVPVGTGEKKQNLKIQDGDFMIHNVQVILANGADEVKWWGYLDMSDYIGKEVSLSFLDVEDGATSAMFECADEPRTMPDQPLFDEASRPQFHMSQMNGWSNDPNGMTYYDGSYHLFWQCNPLGNYWGNMYWGHATSPDMINWTEQKRAFRTFGGVDKENRHPSMVDAMAFSGGGHVDKNNSAGWKTGDKDVMFVMMTDTGLGESIAYSTDGGLNFEYWKQNPIIKHKGRDPKPIWYEPGKHWVCVVYDEDTNPELKGLEKRNISFYTSKNLKDWELQSKIFGIFECPELFELAVDGDEKNKKWVLFGATPSYLIGDFDGKKFSPDTTIKGDTLFGNVYAGQCFSNSPDGRVVYIGWARVGMADAPFNQGFSIPLDLTLKTAANGQVHMYANPIEELEMLREKAEVDQSNITLNASEDNFIEELSGELYDVCISIKKIGNPKNVVFTLGDVRVGYDFGLQKFQGKYVPMKDDKLNIRILIDRPFSEAVAGDGHAYFLASRSNKKGKSIDNIQIKASTSDNSSVIIESIKVYPMKSIWKK
jgi:fructan beta-fructosidase